MLTYEWCHFFLSALVIPSEASTASFMVETIDDTLPELDETFTISLTSVELLDNAEGTTVPPSLGSNTQVVITIEASDDPFGSISIAQNTYNVNEGNTVAISLVRMGGTLGVVTVSYATINGRAMAPGDYAVTSGTIVFAQEQTTAEILVPTVDDDDPEIVEDFGFNLLSVSGGSLGNITRATVFIAASDSPFGVVGFNSDQVTRGITIPNPTQFSVTVTLLVTRMGGKVGSTDINWNVTGPGNSGVPSSDITASSIRGTLTLTDGQR